MTYGRILYALSDGTRRDIVELLRGGPRPVGALADALPVSQPAVSQHLKVLRDAGLVASRPDGVRRIYFLRPEGLEPLRAYVDSFWGGALEAFQASFRDGAEEK